jgi:ubiquitin-conjugating enzyme E2 G1
MLVGPADTLYEGGFFKAQLDFPSTFPNMPPEMTFKCDMWHPNVYEDGKVCISILHPPGEDVFNQQESAEERWRPVLGVEQIIVSVLSILSSPNADSPANIDAGVQFRDDKAGFKKRVREVRFLFKKMNIISVVNRYGFLTNLTHFSSAAVCSQITGVGMIIALPRQEIEVAFAL